jgi:hypothetical protein
VETEGEQMSNTDGEIRQTCGDGQEAGRQRKQETQGSRLIMYQTMGGPRR